MIGANKESGEAGEQSDSAEPEIAHGPFGLVNDARGRLVLIDAMGRRHVGVEPVRSFPITDPDRWIVLLDARGRELATVADLSTLPVALKTTLEEELASREFTPVIRRIVDIAGENLPAEWKVETDRGPTRFTLDDEDNIRKLGSGKLMISDAQGTRYLIENSSSMDSASRRFLERFL
jgi:hypothetical protein